MQLQQLYNASKFACGWFAQRNPNHSIKQYHMYKLTDSVNEHVNRFSEWTCIPHQWMNMKEQKYLYVCRSNTLSQIHNIN